MPIKNGDTVKVHYTGTIADGTVFDSSEGRAPLEFTLGAGQLIPGFESAVLGHETGDRLTVTIPAEQAYGAHDNSKVLVAPRDQFPPDLKLEPGQMLTVSTEAGTMDVLVIEVGQEQVILDANHPLADEALTFAITIVEVR